MTSPGIDPGTVRLVAQRLNHYATPGPHSYSVNVVISCLRIKVVLPVSSGELLAAIEPEVKMFPQPPYCYFKFHSEGLLKTTRMCSKMYYHTRFQGTK